MTATALNRPGRNWRHGEDYLVSAVSEKDALLFWTANHRLFRIDADLGHRLRDGFAALKPTEFDEWAALEAAGMTSPVNREVLARSSYADGANLALNINLTGRCNLDCSYCFADGGDYGRITNAMGTDLLPAIFDFIDRHHTRSRIVRFELFGGEPLLNFGMIQALSDRAYQYSAQTGVEFRFRISTNLTVMPKGVVDFFAERHCVVSVSIDGGPETQNRNRPTKGGKGSYEQIMENCQAVRAGGDDIALVARMTVVGSRPSLIENVRLLWGLNIFDYFQIYPGVTPVLTPASQLLRKQRDSAGSKAGTVEPTFLMQMSELMEVYPSLFGPEQRFRGILEYEQIAEMVTEGKLAVAHCGGGGTYFTFSPDGSINPCHRLVGDRSFEVDGEQQGLHMPREPWTDKVDSHPVCGKCWARYICGGNCRQENHAATNDIREVNPEACNYQLRVIEEVIKHLASDRGAQARAARAGEFDRTPRDLRDLFVSCGRPIVENQRPDTSLLGDRTLIHFRPL